jgi:peptidyl-prolyl cis-trans isomerase C
MLRTNKAAALGAAAIFLVSLNSAIVRADAPPSASATGAEISRQGKAVIYEYDVDAHVRSMPPKDRAGFIDSPKRIQTMLGHLMLRRNLAIEARELKLDQDAITQREFEQAIEGILMRRRLDHIRDTLVVPDLEPLARERYMTDKEQYRQPETYTVAHVLLDTNKRTADEAVAKLKAWRQDILDGKTTIEEVAKANSDDPGVGSNSGVYADARLDTFVPEFGAAIAKLKSVGDITEPVKTEFGYHLIQLKARHPSRLPSYDELKQALVEKEREKFIVDAQRAHVQALQTLPVEAVEENVSNLRGRYGELKLPTPTATTPAAAEPATTENESGN